VNNTETAIKQKQEDVDNAESMGRRTREPKNTFQVMLNPIRVSLCNLARSDAEEVSEHQQDADDSELDELHKLDEPGWVMGIFIETVQYYMDRFLHRLTTLDELTHPGNRHG
jgi:hypothetical protein